MKKQIILATVAVLSLAGNTLAGTSGAEEAARPPVVGKVIQTTNAEGYTYVLVQQGNRKTWVASRQFDIAVGDKVNIPDGWVMKDFKSRTLNRTFDWILFAPGVEVNGRSNQATEQALPPGHPPLTAGPTNAAVPAIASPIEVKKGSVQKVPGGYTVEECYSRKNDLKGRTVKVRGVVVKFSAAIMGRNWVHLRDGTGAAGADDLTLTTQETVKKGDTIVAEGKMACDKDFGAGYKYAVLLEDAVVGK